MSGDYTPNLNQARAYYSAGRMDEEFVTVEQAMAEFDRFISVVRGEEA